MKTAPSVLGEFKELDTPGFLKGAKYYYAISQIMQAIHSKIPVQNFDTTKIAAPTSFREEYFNGENRQRAVMYLMSNGCEWALKSGNGCLVCGHLAKQAKDARPIPAYQFIHQFQSEFSNIDFRKHPILNLYNNGSFFNDNEIPDEARKEIYKQIQANRDIKMVVFESRPEFIQMAKIEEIRRFITDKHVEIAMGLELVDDHLRYICINKGFSLKQFERAATIIVPHFHLRTYAMLKPPFLNERESIEQAVATIEYAFKAGSTSVSLEACTIQDYTFTKFLYEKGFYQTAWLWSIIEVIKRTAHLGKVVVGLFQFYPSPTIVPYNCDQCSERVMEAIRQYNRSLNAKVFDDLNCKCKDEWDKVTQKEGEDIFSFSGRLDSLLGELKISE